MVKDNFLVINAPREGIAQSPHIGFADVRNLDIYSIPGVVQLNNILAKKSASTVTGQPNWSVRHPVTTGEVYELDAAGVVYKSTDSGVTWAVLSGSSATSAHGNGLWIWKNYLFVARDALLDVCGDGTATGITAANWTLGWKTIDSDVLWHPMLTSNNDSKLYGGAGRFVYSLEELTTFAPGSGATYTFTQQALDLPASYRIKCIEELGNNLMLGTWQGTNIYDIRKADIFPWDRSSTSFGQPIPLNTFGVHAMLNTGNQLVVLAGISGIIYACNGVSGYEIGRLPIDLSGGKYLEYYPGSICQYKSKTFFGVGQGGSTAISNMGVYSLQQTGKGNILNLEHLVSTLSDGTTNPLKPSTLLPITRDTLLVGWRDNATYGLDLTTNTSYAYGTDYSGFFITPMYQVGTLLVKMKYGQVDFVLAKALATGEGIKIEYRTDINGSFTTVGTFTYTNLPAILSHSAIADLPDVFQVQFRISLLGTSTTTPRLLKVVFSQ